MRNRLLIFAAGFLILQTPVFAFPKPKDYLHQVAAITRGQKIKPKHPVFVGPLVQKPGAYELVEGMTVASIVTLAGGVTDYPTRIIVRRPTKENPNPQGAAFECDLDQKRPAGGVTACNFLLVEKDLVEPIRPSGVMP